jgi:Holliday junction resolvase RusA-like endonuclease
VECDLRLGPLAARQAQGSDTARFLIRVTSFRRRLLDEDNLCEKYVVDCCRYAGFIPDDAPGATHIETRQEKVGSKAEERTEISIEDLSHGRSL